VSCIIPVCQERPKPLESPNRKVVSPGLALNSWSVLLSAHQRRSQGSTGQVAGREQTCRSFSSSDGMQNEENKDEGPKLNTAKHISYHKRCLQLLPTAFQSNDLNRMSLAFFTLNALDILDAVETTTAREDRQAWIDWIYSCQLDTGGFRGSPATKLGTYSLYDALTLPSTYFAIALLLILGDDLARVQRSGTLAALRKAQNEDGSFSPVLLGGERDGEVDVRHTYSAAAVRCILSPVEVEEDFDVAAAIKYVRSCRVCPSHIELTIGI